MGDYLFFYRNIIIRQGGDTHMSTKNAYEIRLEILKEAQGNCWNRYHQDVEAARLRAFATCGEDKDNCGDYMSTIKKPTPEQVIEEANKLYSFVNG